MIGMILLIQMMAGYLGAFWYLFHKPEWLSYIFFIFALLNTFGLGFIVWNYESYINI